MEAATQYKGWLIYFVLLFAGFIDTVSGSLHPALAALANVTRARCLALTDTLAPCWIRNQTDLDAFLNLTGQCYGPYRKWESEQGKLTQAQDKLAVVMKEDLSEIVYQPLEQNYAGPAGFWGGWQTKQVASHGTLYRQYCVTPNQCAGLQTRGPIRLAEMSLGPRLNTRPFTNQMAQQMAAIPEHDLLAVVEETAGTVLMLRYSAVLAAPACTLSIASLMGAQNNIKGVAWHGGHQRVYLGLELSSPGSRTPRVHSFRANCSDLQHHATLGAAGGANVFGNVVHVQGEHLWVTNGVNGMNIHRADYSLARTQAGAPARTAICEDGSYVIESPNQVLNHYDKNGGSVGSVSITPNAKRVFYCGDDFTTLLGWSTDTWLIPRPGPGSQFALWRPTWLTVDKNRQRLYYLHSNELREYQLII